MLQRFIFWLISLLVYGRKGISLLCFIVGQKHLERKLMYGWGDLHCCSVAKLCPTICDPMDCSMPGFPVRHQLPELAQTHVHWVIDAIQPSHLLSPFSSCLQSCPASGSFPMGHFFTSGGQSTGVSASASVLPMNIQDWFPLRLSDLISLQSKGLSRASSPTPQSKSINSSVLSFFHSPTLTSSDFNPQVRWKIQISVEHTYF